MKSSYRVGLTQWGQRGRHAETTWEHMDSINQSVPEPKRWAQISPTEKSLGPQYKNATKVRSQRLNCIWTEPLTFIWLFINALDVLIYLLWASACKQSFLKKKKSNPKCRWQQSCLLMINPFMQRAPKAAPERTKSTVEKKSSSHSGRIRKIALMDK